MSRSAMSFRGPPLSPILRVILGTLLLGNGFVAIANAEPLQVSLVDATRQAIAANLDLMAQRQSLEAAREEIGLARSPLLPQVDFGARGQYLEDERADDKRGNNKTESFLVGASLSQVIYDEDSWAGFSIQKHVYEGQVRQLQAFELGVIEDAAGAFIALDKARHELAIQLENREITKENLEQSRARIAAGWSSEREILRWQTQQASNDTAVRVAQAQVLEALLELNRVRNLSPETPAAVVSATLEEYGFVYSDETIASAIVAPENDRRMRDVLVRAGIARSPQLAVLDASIAAAERQLTANRRAFWIPTLSFKAGVDYLANHSNEDDDFEQTEWGVKGLLAFPVFEGGAKFAGRDQAQAALSSLRTQRRASAQTLEQTIRAAFARATGSYEGVGFARQQTAAAKKNYDLVDQSYTLGVASILDLLDAQTQLLGAQLTLIDAIYGFFGDLLAAERSISFFAFIQEESEVDGIVDEIAQQLKSRP